MPAPTFKLTLRYAGGPAFGPTLVLNSAASPLGTGVFGTSTNDPIDITAYCTQALIRRGRTRVLDKFEAGVASFDLIDEDGTFDPENGTFGNPAPMLQVRMTGTFGGSERFLFSGFTQEFDYQWDPNLGAAGATRITVTCVDAFRAFYLSTITAVTGTSAGQTGDQRIDDILDDLSWPTGVRDLDTGDTTLVDDDGSARTALEAMQAVATAEMGGFWIDVNGDVRFMSRSNTITTGRGTPTVFDDDGSDIAYQAVDFEMDEQLLINEVSITRSGGSAQTASDATSISDYFQRNYTRTGLLMDSDAQAQSYADTILAARKDPELRIKSITLNMDDPAATTRVAAGLDLDFFSPIQVTRSTLGSHRITKNLVVQGVTHDISPHSWSTTLNTAELIAAGFILDTDKLGTGVLGF